MLYFIPWAVLMLAVIVAVPVAAKMASGGRVAKSDNGDAEMDEQAESEDSGDDQDVLEDDFGGGDVEPLEDDAFEELK
ncbi:hypothetical protein Enr13x_52310 [Stieleria neptunia]|uniref:Uncharacterized protein n=1 Tax=Stieleria neptunia TaxID=2527979 RepID=A0A518HWX2_9BACT|nr:hypothetical protein [Stieleria neptunia]QDV45355.1 hypothetical protein Enr13x_52310 [Stieleria neptunia]